jgi:hypothetical protein
MKLSKQVRELAGGFTCCGNICNSSTHVNNLNVIANKIEALENKLLKFEAAKVSNKIHDVDILTIRGVEID